VGRVQSREYTKKLENGETITKTAYEVSVIKLFDVGVNSSRMVKNPFSTLMSNMVIKNNYQNLKTANID